MRASLTGTLVLVACLGLAACELHVGPGVDEVTLNLYWNINGTIDGSDTGDSWDTCGEVGATRVSVIVSGVEHTFECSAGNMSAAIYVPAGPHSVSMRILGPDGALTEAASGDVSTPGDFIGDFYWYSFFEPRKSGTTGDYLFETTWEGTSCTAVSPAVEKQVTLLNLDGSPVQAMSCGPDNTCTPTNGANQGPCYGPDMLQRIASLKWGDYKLKISGVTGLSLDTCWEQEYPILVGAGTLNPIFVHDVPWICD